MITDKMIDFILKETKMRFYKYQWGEQDPFSQVLLSRNINDGIYNVEFHRTLNDTTLKIFEFDVDCSASHIWCDKITITACIFVCGDYLVFKILESFEYNESHIFHNIDELCYILRVNNLLQ